jgi:hypothetical protein
LQTVRFVVILKQFTVKGAQEMKLAGSVWLLMAVGIISPAIGAVAASPPTPRCIDSPAISRSRSLMRHAETAIAAHHYREANQLLDRFEAAFHDPLPNPSPRHFIDDSGMILSAGKVSAKQRNFRSAALDKHQALSSRLGTYDWKCDRAKNGRLSGGMMM